MARDTVAVEKPDNSAIFLILYSRFKIQISFHREKEVLLPANFPVMVCKASGAEEIYSKNQYTFFCLPVQEKPVITCLSLLVFKEQDKCWRDCSTEL